MLSFSLKADCHRNLFAGVLEARLPYTASHKDFPSLFEDSSRGSTATLVLFKESSSFLRAGHPLRLCRKLQEGAYYRSSEGARRRLLACGISLQPGPLTSCRF